MKHKDKLLLPALLAVALAASPALAQSTSTPGAAGGSTVTTTPGVGTGSTGAAAGAMQGGRADSVLMFRPRLSQLIGTNVYNDRNETIGEVDDIVLAPPAGLASTSTTQGSSTGSTTTTTTTGATGTTTPMPGTSATGIQQGPMAVIQVGGFLGMGGRLVMVPLSELQWNAERERIIMPNASKESLQGRPAFTYDSLRRG